MKPKWILLLFLSQMCGSMFTQEGLHSYITEHSNEVLSIQFNDTNYQDLENIGSAIKGCRVIFLGEMWHGDGATFEAKSRLIRFLHEKHGFNILSFESDFYALAKAEQARKSRLPSFDSILKKCLPASWWNADQCQALFRYLEENPGLKIAGVDNQLHFAFSKTTLEDELKKYLDHSSIPYVSSNFYQSHFWQNFKKCQTVFTTFSYKNKIPFLKTDMEALIYSLDSICLQLQSAANFKQDLLFQTLYNIRSLADMYRNIDHYSIASSERDRQMADNLSWLVMEHYPGEKIIVWLASAHMVKNNKEAYLRPVKEASMGQIFFNDKKNPAAYFLGFTSHNGSGHYITNTRYRISRTKAGSVEDALNKKNRKYLFVSLKDYIPKKTEKYLYGKFDGGNNLQARWNESLDGIFYIRTMTPATTQK